MSEAASLDPRINAFLPELADARLKGQVESQAFAEGELKRVIASSAPLRRVPRDDVPIDSEVIRGETVRVFGDTADGWSWCQCLTDSYVGFVPFEALGAMEPQPTHRVAALRTFLYPGPDLKLPPSATLFAGSLVAIDGETTIRGTLYRRLYDGEGAIPAVDLEPLDHPWPTDFVAMAERLVETPYLWGGRTSLGVDCSGLVQLALGLTGRDAPRDTDLQANTLGEPVDGGIDGRLQRGDLAFWPGHALIIGDRESVIHASGFHMRVVIEPLAEAFARILEFNGPPTAVRRLEAIQPIGATGGS
ncbi:MAG: C40 family peptidase [bacterium]|nr:C40 family peptidase [bacterium]